jgi:hypothetical protein
LETIAMKPIMACLMLAALAAPAYAGHGSIEETDDGYVVEYSGDTAEKPDDKGGHKPAPVAPPAAQPDQAAPRTAVETPASDSADDKPARARPRDQSRRERGPRPGGPGEE